jgi:tetratricopeptide (TPR) repeat protein
VGEWKYIAAPKPELYDLRTDKAEARNLAAERETVAGRLAADLARVAAGFSKSPEPAGGQPDAATVERLQALGYVGAFAPVTAGTGAEDPKDHVAEYRAYREQFSRALSLLGRGRARDAVPVLQRLVKANVRAFEAHLYLGNVYAAISRPDAALGEYDASSQLNPSLATPHVEAAKVLSATNDYPAAVARVNKALALDPRSSYAHYTLGVIHQRAGRWQEAASAFSTAVALNPVDPRAHANLAAALMRLGDLAGAAVHFERMVALRHQVAPAQFNLGVIAARRGDAKEAARRYRLALDADPTFQPARQALEKLDRR